MRNLTEYPITLSEKVEALRRAVALWHAEVAKVEAAGDIDGVALEEILAGFEHVYMTRLRRTAGY